MAYLCENTTSAGVGDADYAALPLSCKLTTIEPVIDAPTIDAKHHLYARKASLTEC